MNITERIEQVMDQRGINKSELARRMNKHNQQVNRLIDNPKWETIESVASAIGIAPWELFTQEIEAAGYCLAPEQQPSAQPSQQPAAGTEPEQKDDALPFGNSPQPSALAHQSSLQQAIICPHCGHALVMNVVSEEIRCKMADV